MVRPSLIDLLPEALAAHQVPDANAPSGFRVVMADFLKAFEEVLLQREVEPTEQVKSPPGLEQIVDELARFFTPGTNAENGTPDEFLPWLSQWVALSLRADIYQAGPNLTEAQANELNLVKRREFIERIASVYPSRGTKQSMKDLLEIFTGAPLTIDDQVDGQPHFFKVLLNLEALKGSGGRAAFFRAEELAHSVIRLEKPAHTRYLLIPMVRTMRIGRSWRTPEGRDGYYIQLRGTDQEGNALLGFKPIP